MPVSYQLQRQAPRCTLSVSAAQRDSVAAAVPSEVVAGAAESVVVPSEAVAGAVGSVVGAWEVVAGAVGSVAVASKAVAAADGSVVALSEVVAAVDGSVVAALKADDVGSVAGALFSAMEGASRRPVQRRSLPARPFL